MSRATIATCFLLLVGVGTDPTTAQQTGLVSGRVIGDGGGALPGVTVTASGPALSAPHEVISQGTGSFKIVGLAPGTYNLTFRLPGFRPQVREDVQVIPGATSVGDVVLSIGCLEHVFPVVPSWQQLVDDADLIAHVKIETVLEVERTNEDRCYYGPDYRVGVIDAFRPPASQLGQRPATVLIPTHIGDSQYPVGGEYVLFLQWWPEQREFQHLTRMMPVTDQKLADGEPVEAVLARLRGLVVP